MGVWFCGYEERSPWLVRSPFRPPMVDTWFQAQVEEDRDVHRAPENLAQPDLGELLGARPSKRNWDGHWRMVWRHAICEARARVDRPIDLFIDISSMPRAVYAPLLVEASRESAGAVASITMGYVPGDHKGSIAGHQQLDGLRTIAGLEGRSAFEGDPALIVGLGYDGVLADTVVDLFQLEHVSCFYADPGATSGSADRCRRENALLLEHSELVETAAVSDLNSWLRSLERLASWYSQSRDVMVLPLGPKPQVVASILFALRDPLIAFRCLRTSKTRPIDVGVPDGAEPLWMEVRFDT